MAQQKGILLYGRRSNDGKYGDNILIVPPLNITKNEIDVIVNFFFEIIYEYEDALKRDGYI